MLVWSCVCARVCMDRYVRVSRCVSQPPFHNFKIIFKFGEQTFSNCCWYWYSVHCVFAAYDVVRNVGGHTVDLWHHRRRQNKINFLTVTDKLFFSFCFLFLFLRLRVWAPCVVGCGRRRFFPGKVGEVYIVVLTFNRTTSKSHL